MLGCRLDTDWQMDRGGCSQRQEPSILQRLASVNCCEYVCIQERSFAKQGGTADSIIRPYRDGIFLSGRFCFIWRIYDKIRQAMASRGGFHIN